MLKLTVKVFDDKNGEEDFSYSVNLPEYFGNDPNAFSLDDEIIHYLCLGLLNDNGWDADSLYWEHTIRRV